MECYNHKGKDAVGMCSRCNKFVCRACIDGDEPVLCKSCSKKVKGGQPAQLAVTPVAPPEPMAVQALEMAESKAAGFRGRARAGGPSGGIGGLFGGGPSKPLIPMGPSVWGQLHSNKPLLIDNKISFDIVTPVLLFGIISGILLGIPLLGLLFFIIIPLALMFSIIYIRMENDYQIWVGEKKGMATGLLVGVVASLISFIIFIATTSYLGPMVSSFFTGIAGNGLFGDILITLASANSNVSMHVLQLRIFVTLIVYGIFGVLFGRYFSRKIR